MRTKATSAYLRITFDVDDPAEVVGMSLDLFYEDGFAAYLNGSLVASSNLPSPLAYDSISTDRGEVREGDPMVSFSIDFSGKLLSGDQKPLKQVKIKLPLKKDRRTTNK